MTTQLRRTPSQKILLFEISIAPTISKSKKLKSSLKLDKETNSVLIRLSTHNNQQQQISIPAKNL